MKTLLKLLLFVVCIGLFAGCEKEDLKVDNADLKKANIVNHEAPGLDQERWVTIKELDMNVHYRIIGKGPINVVWLPGWTNPLTVYDKQFDYFRDKARCIYIDHLGQGLSDAPPAGDPLNPEEPGFQYTMDVLAEAVYTVVKKEGLHNFVAVGFSMGPMVWGMFERQHPGMIYKLVNLDGGFSPWPTDPAERDALQAEREANYQWEVTWDETIKGMLLDYLIPPDLVGEDAEELKEWGQYFLSYPSDILANMDYYTSAEDANEPVGWTYPKLCFYSNPSPNMDKVNLIYPNNTTYTFPGGGHCIQWVFHNEINPIIWEFIKDRPGKKY